MFEFHANDSEVNITGSRRNYLMVEVLNGKNLYEE